MSVSQHQCQQVQCGCLSQTDIGAANLYDCTVTYGAGVLNPTMPPCPDVCPPPKSSQPTISQLLPQALQTPVQSPPVRLPGLPVLTAQSIVQPLPDIARSLTPMAQPPPCSFWCDLNGAIQDNPVIAVGVLIGAFLLIRGAK
jgi:hypothetical protein